MKPKLLLASLLVTVFACSCGAATNFTATLIDPAALTINGEFGRAINGQAFQEEMIWSHAGWQYVAYYNAARHVCLARRKLPDGVFERIEFADYEYKSQDAHNTISLGICAADGTIHLAWDHHGELLHYRVSQPDMAAHPEKYKWDTALFGPVRDWLETNRPVTKLTYPVFFATPAGGLHFSYRYGSSGRGDWWLVDYDGTNGLWRRARQFDSGQGIYVEGTVTNSHRSSYPNRHQYGPDGKLQLTWVWRESSGGPNHDLNYAWSDDGGMTWRNNGGDRVSTSSPPAKASAVLSLATPGLVVVPIGLTNGLMNTQAQAVDSHGRVHVVMWHCTAETQAESRRAGLPQNKIWGAPAARRYHHYWRDDSGVWRHFEIPGEVGTRPQLAFDKNDDAFLIFTRNLDSNRWDKAIYFDQGALVILKAAAVGGWTNWQEVATHPGPFLGEMQVDAYRFKQDGVLSIVAQNTPAKPGDPSALSVLDFRFTGAAGDLSVVSPGDFCGDGGWCWFADPRAVVRDGKIYAGWVTSDGSVQIGVRNLAGGDTTTATLHAQYQRDDHDNPALLFLPDGRLTAFYSRHAGAEMNARTTARPGDISEWTPERVIDFASADRTPKNVTYPNPVLLSGETNAIYLFWRGDHWKPSFSKSIDGGATWSPQQEIVRRPGAGDANRPYVKVASNGRDRIHLIFTDGHPRNEASNSVYYACFHDGAFFKADGTRIAGMDELPFSPEQADRVYDAATTGIRAWVWDLAFDAQDRPVIAYTRLPATTDHRYHYARWDGKTWRDTELTAAGKWFPETAPGKTEREPHYSGGLALDHGDPATVYLSRPVNGVFEIEKWTTPDGGQTWSSNVVTAGSAANNVRPFVAQDVTTGQQALLWQENRGGYVHYTDYRAVIRLDAPAVRLPPLSAAIETNAILTAMERVADWQLAHPSPHKPCDWTQGAGYAGIMALDKISGSPRFREAMFRMGESNRWQLGPDKYSADDHCVGQAYVELWQRTNDARFIALIRERFDFILAHPPGPPSLEYKQKGARQLWSWCDALFMAPPVWVRLAAATGDARYRDYAVTNWWRTSDYLYDPDEHLYFRDSTYFAKREANGKKVFWSRGNGWVMGGLVRVLQFLPANDPSCAAFETQFKQMAAKILECQQPDGLWRASLLDPASYPLRETSGSGFYTYALAWGVNEGLLDRAQFEPAIRRAWAALVGCVAPNGKLTHVQPIGADPKHFVEDATEIYGVGAFLLAGSEVYRLAAH